MSLELNAETEAIVDVVMNQYPYYEMAFYDKADAVYQAVCAMRDDGEIPLPWEHFDYTLINEPRAVAWLEENHA